MKASDKPRKGRRHSFQRQADIAAATNVVPTLRFLAEGYRKSVLVDFSGHRPLKLALEFAGAVQHLTGDEGTWRSEYTIEQSLKKISKFFEFVTASKYSGDCSQLLPIHIDEYQRWLAQSTQSEILKRHYLNTLIVVLRTVEDALQIRLDPSLSRRISFVKAERWVAARPRDAYPISVTAQLRRAARVDVAAAQARLKKSDADQSPDMRRVLAEVDDRLCCGLIYVKDPLVKEIARLQRRNDLHAITNELNARAHLTIDDALAFAILISIDTGLESECVKDLTPSSLREKPGGGSEIVYVKHRSHSEKKKTIDISENGNNSPGMVIRILTECSGITRNLAGVPYILSYCASSELKPRLTKIPVPAFARFVRRHNIVNEDGHPIRLCLARIRKDHKAILYRRVKGDPKKFPVNHTKEVAFRHYANVDQLRDLHEQTIVDGLTAAFNSEVAIASNENANSLEQTWIASCRNPIDSPYGRTGRICNSPFWGCLDCRNAVFSDAKIPALTAFALVMRRERQGMSEVDWAHKFGRAYLRITEQILPRLPAHLVAQAVESSDGGNELYLPPEVLQ